MNHSCSPHCQENGASEEARYGYRLLRTMERITSGVSHLSRRCIQSLAKYRRRSVYQKELTAVLVVKYFYKNSILDVRQGSEYASEAATRDVLYKKGVLKTFAKFTGKHLYKSLFLIKLEAQACNLIKKETLAQVFPVNFAKFLRTSFFYRTPLDDCF